MRVNLETIRPWKEELVEFLVKIDYETVEEFMNKYPLTTEFRNKYPLVTEYVDDYDKESIYNATVVILGNLMLDVYEFDMFPDEVKCLAYWLGQQNENDTKYLIEKFNLDINFMTLEVTLCNLYDILQNILEA